MSAAPRATGGVHPITDTATPWEVGGGLHAWMSTTDPTSIYPDDGGPFVVLEDPDGTMVTLPNSLLSVLARGIIAAHVDSGRTDKWTA